MSVFEIRWFENIPISETVGNGLCAVPGTPRIEPMRVNGITHRCVCKGGNLAARHVGTTTCAVEWYHAM